MPKTLEELTTTTQTSSWIPRDVYARVIWGAVAEEEKLRDIVAVSEKQPFGDGGNTFKVRVVGARTAQGPIAEGASLTSTASSFSVYSITLSKYGDYDVLSGESIEDTSDDVKAKILAEMGKAIAAKIDQVRYDEINTAVPGQTKNAATAGQILLADILDLKAAMEDTKYKPDVLLLSPLGLANFLRYNQSLLQYQMVDALMAGKVAMVAGLRVVVFSGAVDPSATAGATLAYVIDSSRALGEIWGRPLTFEELRVPETDQYKEVCWVRYGASELDTGAIGRLKNA